MKKLLLLTLISSLWSLAGATDVILVSTDGGETKTELSSLQNVEVVKNADNATMTANYKDGGKAENLNVLVFGERGTSVNVVGSSLVSVSVCPNPVSEMLYLHGVDGEPMVTIFDSNGVEVMRSVGTEVNVSSLSSGTYLLSVGGRYVKFIKK